MILKEKESQILQEQLYYNVIGPGLETYILPKKGYQKKFAIFSTRFGSIDNCFRVNGETFEVPEGIAHFLEHKLFEDEEGNAFDRFAALGASSNAFTSFNQTSYLFSCTENFTESLELLLDFVQEPYFDEKSVSKEQGIIEQEILMYEDHPQWRVFFNLLEALYQVHPVRIDIAGTVESIRKITPEVLYQCYYTFYHPRNMALFVVGDVSPEAVAAQVEQNLGRKKYASWKGVKNLYPDEPEEINHSRVEHKMVVSDPIINIGFKDNLAQGIKGEKLFRREIITELLLEIIFGNSEPLYQELYEEGLIDEGFDAAYTVEPQYSHTLIGGETRNPELFYQKIMEEISRVKKNGINQEQLERHRRNFMGKFMRRFNSLEFIANNFSSYRFKDIDFFAFPAVLQGITLSEVNGRLEEHFVENSHAVSLIHPQDD